MLLLLLGADQPRHVAVADLEHLRLARCFGVEVGEVEIHARLYRGGNGDLGLGGEERNAAKRHTTLERVGANTYCTSITGVLDSPMNKTAVAKNKVSHLTQMIDFDLA